MKLGPIVRLLKQTASEWSEDKASRLGAALAFYTAFSLAPLLLIAIAISGLAFGEEAATGRIFAEIQGLVGKEGAAAIEGMIANARQPAAGILATAVAVGALLLGASGVFVQLQDALNTVWEVAPRPGRTLLDILRSRLLSFAAVLGTGFLLLVSLILSAAIAGFTASTRDWLPAIFIHVLQIGLSLVLTCCLFALIFKLLPDVYLKWGDVWIGAITSAVLFTIGKFLLGFYLGRSAMASSYGAAGTILIVLLWVYYAAQILLFGAELTQVHAARHGAGQTPTPEARPVTEERREEEGMVRKEEEGKVRKDAATAERAR